MRHGIRRHEQFKTEETRQQMLVNVSGPKSGLMLFLEPFADLLDDFKQKRAGAGGGIKDEHTMGFFLDFLVTVLAGERELGFVSQTIFQTELVAQQPVNALDDVGNDRFRRVI